MVSHIWRSGFHMRKLCTCRRDASALLSIFLFWGVTARAADPDTPAPEPPPEKNVIRYQYDAQEDARDELGYESGIERLFRNPVLASGLESGSDALNRSIESIMEVVFYSLLDNDISKEVTASADMVTGLKRDLFNTTSGHYVVVDRFRMGPEYRRQLAEIQGLSLNLNISANANIYHIYLRSDAIRLAEQSELPWYRRTLNNWFGLLPILSRVLPPSFNANELYDPIQQLGTPFIFPSHAESFRHMAIGSIVSYAMNSGLRLPFDIAAMFGDQVEKALSRIESLKFTFPLSIFLTGEHRINVLRRSENIAWVGLSRSRKLGMAFSTEIGSKVSILNQISPWWSGVQLPLFPVSLEMSKAKFMQFDMLYEFDLRNPAAIEAYERAVAGDFVTAHRRYLDKKEKDEESGVWYHFTRNETGDQGSVNNTQNLLLTRYSRLNNRTAAELEIVDERGRLYVLEARQEQELESWDALLGSERIATESIAELRVNRVIPRPGTHPEEYTYVFSASESDPVSLTLAMRLQDRYTDAEEYDSYVQSLRRFTRLPLDKVPKIPMRDARRVATRRNALALNDATTDRLVPHTPPTFLGRLSATAAARVSYEQLNHIVRQSENRMWGQFAEAFGRSANDWSRKAFRDEVSFFTRWLNRTVFYPMRLLGFYNQDADFFREVERSIAALRTIRGTHEPLKKVNAFYELFASDYPDKVTRALLGLSQLAQVPRSVSFVTRARGSGTAEVKEKFDSLDGKVFQSSASWLPPERQRIAKEKLLAFIPTAVRERRSRPIAKRISVGAKEIPEALVEELTSAQADDDDASAQAILTRHVFVRMQAQNVTPGASIRVYVKFDQGGRLQLGKFNLAEQVITVSPLESALDAAATTEITSQNYEFWLTGPLSPLRGVLFDQAILFGGEFEVSLAISEDGQRWSDEKALRFRFEQGQLTPP